MQIFKFIAAYIQSKRDILLNLQGKGKKILPQIEFCWRELLEAEWHQT